MAEQLSHQQQKQSFNLTQARSLVPLKEMGQNHLGALLQGHEPQVVFAGQPLFQAGAYDGEHVYLLHGRACLEWPSGERESISGRETLMPLAQSQPRYATAWAETDCSVLRLNSERLDKLLTWSQVADYLQLIIARQRDLDEDIDWMMTVLRSNLFFKVPPLNVEQIFYRLKPRLVEAGDTVIRQGEMGDVCYFLKEGRAEVHRHKGGHWQHLADIEPGRCFGEDALVEDAPRNARVRMLTDGVLMCLDKQDFYRLLREPEVPETPLDAWRQAQEQDLVLIDCRSEEEYDQGHLPYAVNVPLGLLAIKSPLLQEQVEYLCYCDTGRRSRATTHLLRQQGYIARALGACPQLFADADQRKHLTSTEQYLLRDGRAQLAQ